MKQDNIEKYFEIELGNSSESILGSINELKKISEKGINPHSLRDIESWLFILDSELKKMRIIIHANHNLNSFIKGREEKWLKQIIFCNKCNHSLKKRGEGVYCETCKVFFKLKEEKNVKNI